MNPWPQLRHLFEHDDGSLPDIFVEGLAPPEVVAVYEWLMAQCAIAHEPTLWSIKEQRDVPIREIDRPALAFIQGRVESFRHGLAGLSVNGVALPELSVSVEPNGISLDYRMGRAWGEPQVLALFALLQQVRQMAPGARIYRADEGSYARPNAEFSEAFDAYAGSGAPRSPN